MSINQWLKEKWDCLTGKNKKAVFVWKIGRAVRKEVKLMLELTCTNEEKIEVTVNPTSTVGNPALLDGPVTVEIISGNGTVEMTGDRSFFVVSGADPGDTEFLVKADADLGTGVVEISDIVRLSVTGAMAANLGLSASAPIPK